MSTESGEEWRGWAEEKRAFVADHRDEVAAERDRLADVRDRLADDREAELEERERRLNGAGAEFGGSAGASVQLVCGGDGGSQVRQDRDRAGLERRIAAAERNESTKRRDANASPTRLAMAFADIAEHLYSADGFDEVLARIAETAVSTVAGCEMASITLRDLSGYHTAASTDPAATAVDVAQYESQEGPCLDALDAPMVYAHSFPDGRWPNLASRPTESGIQSVLSYGLRTTKTGTDAGDGSLNSYGSVPSAFDGAAQEIGLILAAHASVAARAVGERSRLEALDDNLRQALLSRDVIGQAKGILMERLKITPEDAFDVLRHASQRLNVKLREVAAEFADTGALRISARSSSGFEAGHDEPARSGVAAGLD